MTTKAQEAIELLAIETARERLRDYLRGFGRGASERLTELGQHHGWQDAAQNELRKRALLLLSAFDDEMLRAIAQGDIVVNEVIREVFSEIEGKRQG